MPNLQALFNKEMPNQDFCVDVVLREDLKRRSYLKAHWHEYLQFYYFTCGEAVVECAQNRFCVCCGTIAVINSNEMHYLESLSDHLKFYVIRIDPAFLFSSQVDLVQTKYLVPLSQNRISFQNCISKDPQILNCITNIIEEYNKKQIGFELAVKSYIYQLIVLLLRNYISKILSKDEFEARCRALKRFDVVFNKIERDYREKMSLSELAGSVNVSPCHFCRTFKQLAGKTATDYINGVRLEKSILLLKQNNLNITEIALECGFDSVNYFSRLFRRNYHISPTEYRRSNTI